ncbi:galactose oxidase early set domain-containing protein [Streptomyces sp. YIM 98790]|uniref:galactose oxidase early set domain-containing protein n=1 Tax=Streptomyces sp. YIM 98790 TaxID=2689077 RepID=UPI00140B704C|nr:galactose oxidase early set domain-containing protein [Streptomyces sp. YIM 98790]
MARRKLSRLATACAVVSAVTASTLLAGTGTALGHSADGTGESGPPSTLRTAEVSEEEVAAEVDPEEAAVLGQDHAEEHAKVRIAAGENADYPQTTRTASLNWLTEDQEKKNAGIDPAESGQFTDFFPSPDYGVHIAQLPTGKVLVFSFEPVEDNPNRETAPTQVIGAENAGRAYLWDPGQGTGADAFTAVPPPVVDVPDGKDEPRPAPFFCAGHSFLPNGMLGVFGGNLGGNHGSGAKLALVFDPWEEVWLEQPDLSVGRWYPSVVTGPDGRQLIFSGQSERGWGTPTEIVERWPAQGNAVPIGTRYQPRDIPAERFGADAPFRHDYPHAFALNDGLIYTLGRDSDQQWVFDPRAETREDLPDRPDHPEGRKNPERWYGSAVLLPNGTDGPEAILQMGGDPEDPATYLFKDGTWTVTGEKHFGRTQDNTLILPDGSLFTVNGAPDIRDYGNGEYNPNADQKYRQTELGDSNGENWRLGPVQRLPRGYHSNAVVMPDGRIMITGDELQQIANDPDITDDMHGAIEIYEPAYLHRGDRPDLGEVPEQTIRYGRHFGVSTTTPDQVARAVVLAPSTSTHSVNTSQRHLELEITARDADSLELRAPAEPEDAVPGFYMLFLLDEDGVPSEAQWVQFGPPRR